MLFSTSKGKYSSVLEWDSLHFQSNKKIWDHGFLVQRRFLLMLSFSLKNMLKTFCNKLYIAINRKKNIYQYLAVVTLHPLHLFPLQDKDYDQYEKTTLEGGYFQVYIKMIISHDEGKITQRNKVYALFIKRLLLDIHWQDIISKLCLMLNNKKNISNEKTDAKKL